jgi:hypothetical protein
MSRPTHFDLASAEKTIRASIKNTIAEAMRLASSAEDRELVRLQGGLEDFTVAFALWDMDRLNNGGERNDPTAADALGYTIGNAIASFVDNSGGGDAILDVVLGALWHSCNARLSGAGDGRAVFSTTDIPTMQGGNA